LFSGGAVEHDDKKIADLHKPVGLMPNDPRRSLTGRRAAVARIMFSHPPPSKRSRPQGTRTPSASGCDRPPFCADFPTHSGYAPADPGRRCAVEGSDSADQLEHQVR
jgi:hypothetical protein